MSSEVRAPMREGDVAWLTKRAVDAGKSVLYVRRALHPVLQADVVLRERSRDEMGIIERTILALCKEGLGQIDALALGMGIKAHRLVSVVQEIEYRGLLYRDAAGTLSLTELGRLSLEYGAEVVESKRVLLLCGITGRLMPAAAYEVPLVSSAELVTVRNRRRDLIKESEFISLGHLKFDTLPDRRTVNLPDETISVEGVVPDTVRPAFMSATLMLVRRGDVSPSCEVHLAGVPTPLEGFTADEAVGLLEPLGFPFDTPADALAAIVETLGELGATVVRSSLDGFGNPTVEIAATTDRFFESRFEGRSPLLQIGAGDFAPVPFSHLLSTAKRGQHDLLRGRTLTLSAKSGGDFARGVFVLRTLDRAVRDRRGHRARQQSTGMFQKTLALAGISIEEATRFINLACLPWLGEGFEGDAPSLPEGQA